jgi:hypothetical protein
MRNWDWWEAFKSLKMFAKRKGYANPPVNYMTKEGFQLGAWVQYQRYLMKIGKLDLEKKTSLEKIPYWSWNIQKARGKAQWLKALKYLKAYAKQYGNVCVPKKYITKKGFKLGVWIGTQRYLFHIGKLDEWKREILEQIPGWHWTSVGTKRENKWLDGLKELKKFVKKEGHARVPEKHITSSGYDLGNWVAYQRYMGKKSLLSSNQRDILEYFQGWTWDPIELEKGREWFSIFMYLLKYIDREGVENIPKEYTEDKYLKLREWWRKQKYLYRKGMLSQIQNNAITGILLKESGFPILWE